MSLGNPAAHPGYFQRPLSARPGLSGHLSAEGAALVRVSREPGNGGRPLSAGLGGHQVPQVPGPSCSQPRAGRT